MITPRAVSIGVLAFALAWGNVEPARADGKFFALKVADEPGIQAQRAVLVFQDGVETLILQSDVAGDETAYGWLLPLPAEPTTIEACAPNTLTALDALLQPHIAHPLEGGVPFMIAVVVIVLLACMSHVHHAAHPRASAAPAIQLARLALRILVPVLLVGLLLPTLSRHHGLSADITVLRRTQAGVYDIAVIKGSEARGVMEWLSEHGFRCPPSAAAVIHDYVAQDWCFLAARVAPEAGGTATHHPVKVAFPASEAVYPLRLTGSDGQPIQLDLFVVAERQAAATGLHTWTCHRFARDAHYFGLPAIFDCDTPPIFHAMHKPHTVIGVPAVSNLMWSGCIVTRLHGRLGPRDMQKDLPMTWRDASPQRATVFSQPGALRLSFAYGAALFALLIVWFSWRAARQRWTLGKLLRRRFLVAAVLGIALGGVRYLTLDISPTESGGRLRARFATHRLSDILFEFDEQPPRAPFPEAYEAAAHPPRSAHDSDESGPTAGEPGSYAITPAEDGWHLTITDENYVPVTVKIDPDGRPRPWADEERETPGPGTPPPARRSQPASSSQPAPPDGQHP